MTLDMTVDDVKKRLRDIRKLVKKGDYEAAYGAEVGMYIEILQYLADGHQDLESTKLAKEAIKAVKMNHPRY